MKILLPEAGAASGGTDSAVLHRKESYMIISQWLVATNSTTIISYIIPNIKASK